MIKVLITGGLGAFAEYIIRELKSTGRYDITIIDNLSKGHLHRWEDTLDGVHVLHGDCKHTMNMYNACLGKDVVIANAALVGGISYFNRIPYDILEENSLITAATIRAALATKIKQLIYTGSSMTYERAVKFPVREGDELMCPPPKTHYGMSKLMGEYMVRAAGEQYHLPWTIFRLFNMVAIGEDPKMDEVGFSHVIPDAIYKVRESTGIVKILGDGNQIRCFIHAADAAAAVEKMIMNPLVLSEELNIVSGEEWKIIDVFKYIWQKMRPNEPFIPEFCASFPADVQHRSGTSTKAQQMLNWKLKYRMTDILDEAIEFGVRPWV